MRPGLTLEIRAGSGVGERALPVAKSSVGADGEDREVAAGVIRDGQEASGAIEDEMTGVGAVRRLHVERGERRCTGVGFDRERGDAAR